MKRLIACLIASAALCLAHGPKRKVAPDVSMADPNANLDVIIQWKTEPAAAHLAKVADLGGTLKGHLKSIRGAAFSVPASSIPTLAADPDVAYISPDRPLWSKLDLTAAAVNASYAWTLPFPLWGTGIGVAVIDSGIGGNPNIAGRNVVYQQDFVGGGPNDQYGHGTHVAGIIASNGSTTLGCKKCTRQFIGIAPNVNLINLKVLDQNGSGTDSAVIAAIEQAIALKSRYNIRVINLSLGRPVYESYTQDPLCQAVEAAWNAGIVVVIAAGNEGRDNSFGEQGYGTIDAPGNDPYVITVGAMKTMGTPSRTDDLIASYSSKGPTMIDHIVKPDIVAPGNQVVSLAPAGAATLEQNYPSNAVQNGYYQTVSGSAAVKTSPVFFTLSGTSMATPVVSGAVADILQANPSLTPDQVKGLLMETAYKTFPASSIATDPTTGLTYTSYYDIFTVGAGYLDLQAALQSLSNVPPAGYPALSPTAVYDPNSGSVTLSFAANGLFNSGFDATGQPLTGSQAVWGARAVWGQSEVDSSDRAVWGQQTIWGQSSVSSDQALWGQRAIWGQRAVWGQSNTDSGEASVIAITGEE